VGGILFVHGGDALARERFDGGSAYWAQALPIVLEKHGFLDVTTRGPEALDDGEAWAAHDIALLAPLPSESLGAERLARIGQWGVPTLIDGPAGNAVQAAVGVHDTGTLRLPLGLECTEQRVEGAGPL